MKKEQNQKSELPDIPLVDNDFPEEEEQQKKSPSLLRKIFKKKDVNLPAPPPKIRRCNAKAEEGLSTKQVNERIQKGYVNKTVKKYSKTYRSIFVDNICTFFNLLCLLCAVALLRAVSVPSFWRFCTLFCKPMEFFRL